MIKFTKAIYNGELKHATIDIIEPIEATFTDGEGRTNVGCEHADEQQTALQISPTPTPAPSIEATV